MVCEVVCNSIHTGFECVIYPPVHEDKMITIILHIFSFPERGQMGRSLQ